MRPRYNAATVAQVQTRLRAGDPAAQIAKDLNLSLPTVYRWKNPDQTKPEAFSNESKAATLKRLAAGERATVLAAELGVSTQTFYNWRRRANKDLLSKAIAVLNGVAKRIDLPPDVPPKLSAVTRIMELFL
jgi:transposase